MLTIRHDSTRIERLVTVNDDPSYRISIWRGRHRPPTFLKHETTGSLSSEFSEPYSVADFDDSTRFDSNRTTRHSKWRSLIPDVDLQRKTWTSHVLKPRNDCKSFFRIFWTIQCRKCWRFDTIRLESNDSLQLMTIRHNGCRFAQEGKYSVERWRFARVDSTVWRVVICYDDSFDSSWIASIRYHLQTPFTDTCGIFSKCLANRHLIWRVVSCGDESFDSCRIVSIRQHFQSPFTDTCGIFSNCLENRHPVWRVVICCDDSFDSTASSTPFHRHMRNIF